MIERQILSKIINSSDYGFIDDNLITEDNFKDSGYEEEFAFIQQHYKKYGNVPDRATFLSKFPKFEIVDIVEESDKYLIETLREEQLFKVYQPILQKAANIANTDANAGVEYMINALKTIQPNYALSGVDIIANANNRFDNFLNRLENQNDWYFTSGFPELDEITHGIQRGEELIAIIARTNQGKSWVLEKMITHIWQLGYNVGYISPEMSADSIGYRFDTLYKNYSNKDLSWGRHEIEGYDEYIKNLKEIKNKFIVSTPLDFDRRITVSKLRNWIKQFSLDAIAIDGITYMTDERGKRGDNKTTALTNISEDLMLLSIELKVPILVVQQVNRSGVIDADTNGTPELESIRDSDGIAFNASKVISMRLKDGSLELGVKKQRIGIVGSKLKYEWDINTGEFTFIPDYDEQSAPVKNREKKQKSGKDVF